jgi:hypothetical protein
MIKAFKSFIVFNANFYSVIVKKSLILLKVTGVHISETDWQLHTSAYRTVDIVSARFVYFIRTVYAIV